MWEQKQRFDAGNAESPRGRSCWGACLRCLVQDDVWCSKKDHRSTNRISSYFMHHITETYINRSLKPMLRWLFPFKYPSRERQTTHLHPVPGPPPPFLPPFPPWLRSFTSTLHLHTLQSNQGKKHGEKLRISRRNLI